MLTEVSQLDDIRFLVAALPPWSVDLDDDPNWVKPVADFGYFPPVTNIEEHAMFSRVRIAASHLNYTEEEQHPVEIDSSKIIYSGQTHIRLDALLWYMEKDELFDVDGWYGNDYPVIVPWKDGYLVLDGTHRALADRLIGRPCLALVVS